jgi:hypothetical protein
VKARARLSEGRTIESEIDLLLIAAWVTASEGVAIDSEKVRYPTKTRARLSVRVVMDSERVLDPRKVLETTSEGRVTVSEMLRRAA